MSEMTKPTQSAGGLPVISQYWDTDTIPDYVLDLVTTFRDRNPDFQHRVFSESATERFIGEHFGSRELAAFRACAIPSMQSDYLRYCSVLTLGGVYADADYRCVRPLGALVDSPDGGEIFLGPTVQMYDGRKTRRVLSGFFAFGKPGHPLLELTLEIATANIEARIAEQVWSEGENTREAIWLTVGPGIFSLMRFIRDWGSFDAFINSTIGTPAEPFGELYCEVIGDYERIVEVFDGVRVSSYESLLKWVDAVPTSGLPYKQTNAHWHNVRTAIFR